MQDSNISQNANQGMLALKQALGKIKDEGMKNCLIGSLPRNWFRTATNYYTLYYNIFILTFIFGYSKYRALKESGELEDILDNGNANAKRIMTSFSKLYTNYPVSFDLIQFILYDIQYIYYNDTNDSDLLDYIEELFSYDRKFNITDYMIHISKARKSIRYSALNINEAITLLIDLIDHIPFLTNYSLVDLGDNRLVFRSLLDECVEYDTYYSLLKRTGENGVMTTYFYLENIMVKKDSLILNYMSLDDSMNVVYAMGDENRKNLSNFIRKPFTAAYMDLFGETEKEDKLIKKHSDELFKINYKYFKNLALAISDTIGSRDYEDLKEVLYTKYNTKYANCFYTNLNPNIRISEEEYENLAFADDNYQWDNVIVMLLVEVSPSIVLEALISSNRQIVYQIIRNLNLRFNKKISEFGISNSELKNKINNEIKASEVLSKLGEETNRSQSLKELENKIIAKAMSNYIVNILKEKSGSDNRIKEYSYAPNLQTNVVTLKIISENQKLDTKKKFLKLTLGESLKRLICFYEGVLAFGREKRNYEYMSLSNHSSSSILGLSKAEISKYQKAAEDAFFEAAAAKLTQLEANENTKNNEILPLYNELIMLYRSFFTLTEDIRSISDRGKILYSVLGRSDMLDYTFINKLFGNGLLEEATHDNIGICIASAIKILIYLETGATTDNIEELKQKHLNAIFPIIAHYNRGNINKDGYQTALFTITYDFNYNGTTDDKKDMQILSEFEYDLDKDYYCLPNLLRSNDRWWIDPLIIDCKRFNNLFIRKEEK